MTLQIPPFKKVSLACLRRSESAAEGLPTCRNAARSFVGALLINERVVLRLWAAKRRNRLFIAISPDSSNIRSSTLQFSDLRG